MSKTGNHTAKTGAEKNKANTTHKQSSGIAGSDEQEKSKDASANRNDAVAENKLPNLSPEVKRFDLIMDGVPYSIQSAPFLFNDEWRFRIRVNGDEGHVFTWDSEEHMLRGIDDESSVLPIGLEEAISEKLQSR